MAFYPLSPGSDYGQSPDPLTDNWTYDSAIDLFAWNPVMPDLFTLDLPEGFMNFETKGVLGDEFAAPPDIGGYAVASLPEDVSESVSVSYCMSLHTEYGVVQANVVRIPRVTITRGHRRMVL